MEQQHVPIGDLKRQNNALRSEIDAAIGQVIASGWYILGHEVAAFEQEFAAYCGVQQAIGVASGAEALYLALAALDIGPGDEVITVANACMYQASAILQAGAHPVLVDIDAASSTMDVAAAAAAITPRTKAIMPVHLYGRLADMNGLCALAARHQLALIEDAAQAHGAWARDAEGRQRRAGSWGTMACWSFYPSKNLGALGDGGAVTTNDPALAERLRRLRMYGWGSKYQTVELGGRNSRLDELQAAVLRVKLRHLDAGNAARHERAAWYRELLGSEVRGQGSDQQSTGIPAVSFSPPPSVRLPIDEPGHVYHLYVIELAQRDQLRQYLLRQGIGCDVHYPVPAHLQPAYAALGYREGSLPHTERQAARILTLPLFPELTRQEVELVAAAVQSGVAG